MSHLGQQDSLFLSIDIPRVTCLNESRPSSCQRIFKPWDERNEESLENCLQSDADDQILLRIPFTSSVKLRALLLKAGPAGQTPAKLHLYSNAPATLDFDDANAGVPKPTQSIESVALAREVVEYPLRAPKFPAVSELLIFIPAGSGDETVRIDYIGFRGESLGPRGEAPTNIVYESAPQVKDHAKAGTENTNRLG
ncbi:Thioredoxin-like protein [Ceraceosorus bombacis]|uniref:Thioredoxin-like protein n=1 Tax=Ceraceosorus bombacis TaxID=401625 RepID=A0A0P1BLX3_9BASI|nr:Thioredoxin-like protein [Ceraceosorus bombacis]